MNLSEHSNKLLLCSDWLDFILSLPVSAAQINHLTDLLEGDDLSNTSSATINFRDPDYSAEKGGYHPVEIMLFRKGDTWHFAYITDFKYVGQGQDAELEKDFDFQAGVFQTLYGYYRIEEALDIYPVWEENFINHWQDFEVFECKVAT